MTPEEQPYGGNLLIFGTSNFGRHLLETTKSGNTAGNDKFRKLEKNHFTNTRQMLVKRGVDGGRHLKDLPFNSKKLAREGHTSM